ncbi:MAG TPA: zf-HC2 domain-containing protein [Trebonia sp.]|jgi:hypothetical protein|nr:zf-HC2 domain-containing protein [Trebonia sp.]
MSDVRQWDCHEARVALGVYVLGVIDPDERVLLDAHLATCDACAADLADLADLPALLAMIPVDEAIALAEVLPGEDLAAEEARYADSLPALPPVITTAPDGRPAGTVAAVPLARAHELRAARRRRLARAGAVAAAAVVIGGASFGGTKLAASPAPAPGQVSSGDPHPYGQPAGAWQTAKGGNGAAAATVAYRSMGWGIEVDAQVSGLPRNSRCQMYVVEADGTRVAAGGWQTDAAEGTVWYPASASVPPAAVKSFLITVAGGQPITVTPA